MHFCLCWRKRFMCWVIPDWCMYTVHLVCNMEFYYTFFIMYESFSIVSMNVLYPRLVMWSRIWAWICISSGSQLEGSSQRMSGQPAIVQVFSHWFLTVGACVQSRGSTCGICGGQSDVGKGFAPCTLGLGLPVVIPPVFHSLMSCGRSTMGPLAASVAWDWVWFYWKEKRNVRRSLSLQG